MSTGSYDASGLADLLRPLGGSPLHTQVEDRLRQLIRSGRIAAGSRLPGELELADKLGLSRHTMRHALATLVVEGLVRRERGRGTLVLAPFATIHERSLASFYAFAWELRARGVEPRSRVLEFTTVTAPDEVVDRLGLSTDRSVKRLVRIRTAAGEPLVMETAYFPSGIVDDLEQEVLERASIYDEIERRHGLRVTRAQEVIRPVSVSRALARLLSVRAGAPAFHVERTTWAQGGPIEWQEAIVRGDRFLYSVELANPALQTHA